MVRRFLIIQTAFIGDVVLATGLVEKLHQSFPDVKIDFLLRKGNESLLEGNPLINEVLVWDKKRAKYPNLFTLLFKIRSRHYEKVINVQRFAATGFLTAFSGAKARIGFDKNPFSFLFTKKVKHIINGDKQPVHEIERNHELIKHLTNKLAAKPRLYPSKEDFDAVKKFKQTKYICIAPASVWFTKQYPWDKWISFINKLPADYTVYLIGGPADLQTADDIIKGSQNKSAVNLCGQLNFLQSAALQQGAFMNYVNDSAPLHFASAVNAPVTAVYCATVPSFGFGPLSHRSFIVEIKEPLSCRPCSLHGLKSCPLVHFNCAYKIEDEQLLATLHNS